MTNNVDQAISKLPGPLAEQVTRWWAEFAPQQGDTALDESVAESLPAVWAGSEYVARQCLRHPEEFPGLQPRLLQSADREQLAGQWQSVVDTVEDEAGLMHTLRRFRHREMVRILWRDLAGWAELEETCRDLTWLAQTCIDGALNWLYPRFCDQYGTPCYEDGSPMNLVVLGMGKLGAWELNVSSDIDLIFSFADEGETRGEGRTLSHGEFFIKLGQKLIAVLDQQTPEGFVFRVDMRLRPFGDGGPLVTSFDALETYYQAHGREWERYAMIKARVVAGDQAAGEELMSMLHPFVYRRYLDYGAYESLRDMKGMIAKQVRRKGLEQNVKLGLGGIREIEFIAQVFQLIRGGRDPALQERQVLLVLPLLQEMDVLPEFVVRELAAGYRFLRDVEHRLQGYLDQQTHDLPEEEYPRLRLAHSMGFENWQTFFAELEHHRQHVHNHFDQVFAAPQNVEDENENIFYDLWHGNLDDEPAGHALEEAGYQQPQTILQRVGELRDSRLYHSLSTNGKSRLDRLMPLLIGAAGQADDPDLTFERVLEIVRTIARRSVYLALLVENPLVLSQLVKLCQASPWLSRYLSRYPLLLDELMDVRSLYAPPAKTELAAELASELAPLEPDDHEQAMEALRHFKHTNVLRVVAADVSDVLPLMKVSDHLSWIAEVILEEALQQAWRHLSERHGQPVASRQSGEKGFAVIAYGKLGGYELGYGSDLDLVFLHASEDQNEMTDGPQPLAVPVFYARLGQRLIHILTTHTPAGVLYDADLRLRPDGASGMLVSNLTSFEGYQLNKAWLWEHQALVRARGVAGDHDIIDRFGTVRQTVLGRERDLGELRAEVVKMRQRMRTELAKKAPGCVDIKQGEGGMVDIEFLVQYYVLGYAHQYPELLTWTDNIRILDTLAGTGLLAATDTEQLKDAYRAYRDRSHRQALQEQKALASEAEFDQYLAEVRRIWNEVLGGSG
ncbi:bifunctional [glutamate--ammonia ligase]-adenylyl-L-tyrosine phosphorylase/[glutamate--ammonia-ligase] adenylyltransferase [Thiohalophilus sp.]|uniref:bifunctional [glutamate--ammonia ligase]-adenylyl-L-tyrosine phosphorylase/[glutamate--ammonia-ligase] adenylyltransferase n=1 Tax=Thiohalophilus sp. TaxID=3028392 RepID=UPI002ACE53EF|nr:bifunctional [glutamate--ammonia ligase]-adenylyl-L-tyrosine phosphorylase/[glutamate--ammonia-ligase] adenylyltransferase [Thiohalophilus sp.]MDZ7661020.1 bifunctional [glutamate--ammonia ligase]-adenylyl-L-tyrosine phosphorylase/[glutamate--ammonia-ligase] adenylyltransferase [Thiohalophilus sp.]